MIDLAGSERAANTQVGYWMHLSKYFQFSIEHDIIALHWCNGTPPRRLSKYFTFSIEPDKNVTNISSCPEHGPAPQGGGGLTLLSKCVKSQCIQCSIMFNHIFLKKITSHAQNTGLRLKEGAAISSQNVFNLNVFNYIFLQKITSHAQNTGLWLKEGAAICYHILSYVIMLSSSYDHHHNTYISSNDQNTGLRLKEGAAINRSLLALGNCINALAEKKTKYFSNQPHIINIITTFRYMNYHYRHNYNHPYHHHI